MLDSYSDLHSMGEGTIWEVYYFISINVLFVTLFCLFEIAVLNLTLILI